MYGTPPCSQLCLDIHNLSGTNTVGEKVGRTCLGCLTSLMRSGEGGRSTMTRGTGLNQVRCKWHWAGGDCDWECMHTYFDNKPFYETAHLWIPFFSWASLVACTNITGSGPLSWKYDIFFTYFYHPLSPTNDMMLCIVSQLPYQSWLHRPKFNPDPIYA